MPPFQWQAPPSLDPNGTIAALMLRGPDALAAGQIEAARANAASIANSGAIMGNAIAGAGQEIARLPAQLQQQKAQQQESVLRGAQIKEVLDHQKSTATFEAALKNPANYNPDGSPNSEAITKELRSKDIPAWQQWQTITTNNEKNTLEHMRLIQQIRDSDQSSAEKQRAAQVAQTDYLGKLAYVGVQTLDEKPGDPLHARDTAMASVARAAADGVIGEPQARSLNMQLAAAGPDQIRQTLATAIPPDLKAKLDKEAADTAKSKGEAAKNEAEAFNLKTFGRTTRAALQSENEWMVNGKSTPVIFDPDTGQRYLSGDDFKAGKAIPAESLKKIPPASVIINNERNRGVSLPTWATDASRPSGPEGNTPDPTIKMTPNGLHQAALNYIANGQFPPTGRGGDVTAIAQREAVTSKVGAIAADAGMDVPALRAFYKANGASLMQEQKMQDAVQGFMATADKNAALLRESMKKIPDVGSPAFNKPLRAFMEGVAGDANLSQFATYLQSVQNEYGRIISQPNLAGQLTDSARKEAETLASKTATVPQLLASLDALQNEGNNRLVSVGDQIQRIQKRMTIGPGGVQSSGTTPSTPAPIKVGGFSVVVK